MLREVVGVRPAGQRTATGDVETRVRLRASESPREYQSDRIDALASGNLVVCACVICNFVGIHSFRSASASPEILFSCDT